MKTNSLLLLVSRLFLVPVFMSAAPLGADVTGRLIFARLSEDEAAIAAVWTGDSGTDLDLRLTIHTSTREEEVYFGHPQAQGGQATLLRDIRFPTTSEFPASWRETAELMTFNPATLHHECLWLNVFSGSGKIEGRVLVSWRGKIVERPFRFEGVVGDQGHGLPSRDNNPSWRKIELDQILDELEQY